MSGQNSTNSAPTTPPAVTLSESWIGIARLAQTGDKPVCDENEGIDRAFKHEVKLLPRRETGHTGRRLDGVEVWHHPLECAGILLASTCPLKLRLSSPPFGERSGRWRSAFRPVVRVLSLVGEQEQKVKRKPPAPLQLVPILRPAASASRRKQLLEGDAGSMENLGYLRSSSCAGHILAAAAGGIAITRSKEVRGKRD
jgi:hypothetical protein